MKKTIKFILPLVVFEILLFYLAKQYTELTTVDIFSILFVLTFLVLFLFWVGIGIKLLTRNLAYLSYKYRQSENAFAFIGWFSGKLVSIFMAMHNGYKILFVLIVCLYLPGIYNYFTDSGNDTHYLVYEVTDGDTFWAFDGNERIKIRMLGIDTPETKHPTKPEGCYGKQASMELYRLLFEKMVQLDIVGEDKYRRTLAYVYLNDKSVNEHMITEGFAYHSKYPHKYEEKYTNFEFTARKQLKGLWGYCY